MATLDMSVRYFGNDIDAGRMPVRELAPSLIALSEVFQEIQKIDNPNENLLSLDIQATKKGSFVVDLILNNGENLFSKTIDILNSDSSNALINLTAYISIFYGVINLSKSAIGKKFKKTDKDSNGKVKITFDDNTTITIPEKSFEAYKNVEIRKSVKKVVEPVSNDSAQGIDFSSNSDKITVLSNEAKHFEVPDVKDVELPSIESTVALQIISVGFENIKWKFSDGTNQFFASIEDEKFLQDVHENKYQFGSTDILTVELKQKQKMTESGLKSAFFVEKVLEHTRGARQIELDFE